MIPTIAWRNVWRNTRRSGILIASIAFGIWAGALEMAFMIGMVDQQVESAIRTRTSHLQIHAPGFRAHRDASLSIPAGDSVLAAVRPLPSVEYAAGRAVLNVMASSPTTARGGLAYGIDPAAESRLTDVAERMVEGTYFDTDKRNAAVIGERLAKKLGVALGRKIVLTGQGADGEISAGAFRVVGIFRTVNSEFDESSIFVRRGDLSRIFALDGALYEIAARVKEMKQVNRTATALRDAYPNLDVATWSDLSPEVALTNASTRQMNYIFLVVILVALVFGLTNTLLMGVVERTRELGVVIALGMRPRLVFAMVLVEAVFLSVVGAAAGIALAASSIAVLAHTGIDLSFLSTGLAAFGLDAVIYPVMPIEDYLAVALLALVTAIVASIYPGWRAVRLNPVNAIRSYQ